MEYCINVSFLKKGTSSILLYYVLVHMKDNKILPNIIMKVIVCNYERKRLPPHLSSATERTTFYAK